ncbi:MAG: hypothetical protein AAF658_21675 [Myxococcota bacterium]
MLGFLKSNALPPEEVIDWTYEVYRWLLEHTGGWPHFRETPLVQPTPEYFPVPDTLVQDEPSLAQHLFEQTKEHAGLQHWSCELREHQDSPRTGDLMGHVPHNSAAHGGAAGTFRVTPDRRVQITYAAGSTSDPMAFVATMAHELSHYLMATIPVDPPGREDAEEPATDLCAVFLGFGIFVSNSAVRFKQFSDGTMIGWSMSRQGYLSEQALAYALAVFLELLGIDLRHATRYLDPNPRSYLKRAHRHVRRHRSDRINALRAVMVEPEGS